MSIAQNETITDLMRCRVTQSAEIRNLKRSQKSQKHVIAELRKHLLEAEDERDDAEDERDDAESELASLKRWVMDTFKAKPWLKKLNPNHQGVD